VKPTILESCEDVIAIEKYLHTIGVIKDDEPAKDSRDARRKSHAMESNGRDKEATDIETLTHLIKNLTTEASELKQQKTNTSARNHLPKQRYSSNSSGSN